MVEKHMEENYESIDTDIIDVYEIPEWMEGIPEPPSVNIIVGDVSANCPMDPGNEAHRYTVEIEYVPKDYFVIEDSFREFLFSFQTATISQEEMSALIHKELKNLLDIPDVYVNITMEKSISPTDKTVWVGGV